MRIGFLSDLHFPFHHRQAWPLTLKILPDLNLDLLHGGGDWFDLEQLGKYEIPPNRLMQLPYDVREAGKQLHKLRTALPNIPMELRGGNHEWRYNRYLYQKATQLIGVKGHTVAEAFELAKYDIKWIPQDKRVQYGKLRFIHGDEPKVGGIRPARAIYFKVGGNVIAGHFHARDNYFHTLSDGSSHGVWVNSCLRTLRPEWAQFAQWTLGFACIDISKSGFFHVDEVMFLKRGAGLWCSIGGKEYSA